MELGQKIQLTITGLSDNGCGVGHCESGGAVFVPNTVPGDRVLVKLDVVKRNFGQGKLLEILTPSPDRVRPHCIVADKCGGCQWQATSYSYQLAAKQNQVLQALVRLGRFSEQFIKSKMHPIVGAQNPYHYRNKVIYPLGLDREGNLKSGYYQQGSHKIINLNQCPVQDSRLDPLLPQIKQDLSRSGWTIYNEKTHCGNLRHLGFRIGRNTGEIMITIVSRSWELPGIVDYAQSWLQQFPGVVGVVLNRNPDRTNTILGAESRCVAGKETISEIFAGLQLQLGADTFFQVYTEQAEELVNLLLNLLQLQGEEVIVDGYCGIGTLTLPLARHAQKCYGIEIQPQAVAQAQANASRNNLTDRVQFFAGKVETILPTMGISPQILLLDPPRKGCERSVMEFLRQNPIDRVVYVSCNPATLARDLQLLCADDKYVLEHIQPIDFFPQTAHVETLVLARSGLSCD